MPKIAFGGFFRPLSRNFQPLSQAELARCCRQLAKRSGEPVLCIELPGQGMLNINPQRLRRLKGPLLLVTGVADQSRIRQFMATVGQANKTPATLRTLAQTRQQIYFESEPVYPSANTTPLQRRIYKAWLQVKKFFNGCEPA